MIASVNKSNLKSQVLKTESLQTEALNQILQPSVQDAFAELAETDTLDLTHFLNILRGLIREPSVVGCEDAFYRVLSRELEEAGATLTHYKGILVAQGNQPESLILSAHIDRHGLLCTGPNEFQYAAFIAGNKGELDGNSVSEQMLQTIENRFQGQLVQAHMPYVGTYLGQGTITNSYICPERNNLIFEVEGLEYIQPGTPVAFLDRLTVADGYLSAQIDNVISAAIIIYLFLHGFQGTALFTAEEEAGRSWRYTLSWFQREKLNTDRLIVLDTSPFPDQESADAQHIVLRNRDAFGEFAPGITQELADRCDQLGFGYCYKDEYIEEQNKLKNKSYSLGRTELGHLAVASEGSVNGTTLQLPTTEYHTVNETASIESVRAVIQLLQTYITPSS